MKVWIIQPGIAPYRIPLFERIAAAPGIDLTVAIVCEQVPGQQWKIDHRNLKFQTRLVAGINHYLDTERQIQFAFPLLWQLPIHRPDLVICSGFTFSSLLTWICSKLFRIPYVIWNEGTEYSEADISKTKLWLRRIMAKSASAFIIAGILSDKYTRGLLSDPDSFNFYLSYNAVDNSRFTLDADNPAVKQEVHQLQKRLPVRNILYVGKLNERKGIIELMNVYRDLVHELGMCDLGLVLCGTGHLEEYVRKYMAENNLPNVFIEGFVPQEKLNIYYATADVFVLLSHFDCNPLVIFEALGDGIPIVCSYRVGNALDFVRDGENGFSVDPFDHDAVITFVKTVLETIDRDKARTVSRQLVAKANYDSAARAFIDSIKETVS